MANPKLRFRKKYPDWKFYQIKDIVEVNPYTAELPERFVYIDLESVDRGNLTATNIIDRTEAPSRAQRLIEKDDVLFQLVRPYQQNNLIYSGLSQLPAVASTGYAQLRPTKTVTCPSFLYAAVHTKTFLENVLCRCTGGAYPAINTSDLSEISLSMPCIEEQQNIAEFFTAIDEKIRIQLNTVDKLNAIKTGMLAKVFSYENTLDWTVRKFDEIFALTRTFPVSRDQISDECDKTSDNSKIIHYGDILTIYGNIVNPKSDPIGYLVTDVNAKDDDYLCDGDIVFADAAEDYTVGKAIELDGVDCKLLSGLHTIAARPKTSFASGYLSYFFNSPLFKSQVRTLATGTKVMSLTKSSIQTTSISFPSIEEQKKISNLLNTLDNKIAVCNKKLEALKQLKKAFMQRMFV